MRYVLMAVLCAVGAGQQSKEKGYRPFTGPTYSARITIERVRTVDDLLYLLSRTHPGRFIIGEKRSRRISLSAGGGEMPMVDALDAIAAYTHGMWVYLDDGVRYRFFILADGAAAVLTDLYGPDGQQAASGRGRLRLANAFLRSLNSWQWLQVIQGSETAGGLPGTALNGRQAAALAPILDAYRKQRLPGIAAGGYIPSRVRIFLDRPHNHVQFNLPAANGYGDDYVCATTIEYNKRTGLPQVPAEPKFRSREVALPVSEAALRDEKAFDRILASTQSTWKLDELIPAIHEQTGITLIAPDTVTRHSIPIGSSIREAMEIVEYKARWVKVGEVWVLPIPKDPARI